MLDASIISCPDDESTVKFYLIQLGHNEFKVTIASVFNWEAQDVHHDMIFCDVYMSRLVNKVPTITAIDDTYVLQMISFED